MKNMFSMKLNFMRFKIGVERDMENSDIRVILVTFIASLLYPKLCKIFDYRHKDNTKCFSFLFLSILTSALLTAHP